MLTCTIFIVHAEIKSIIYIYCEPERITSVQSLQYNLSFRYIAADHDYDNLTLYLPYIYMWTKCGHVDHNVMHEQHYPL